MISAEPQICVSAKDEFAQSWVPRTVCLRFVFAGVALGAVRWRGMILDAPFTHVTAEPSALPPPQSFSADTQALRICSCPLARAYPRISILRQSIRYIPAQYSHLYVRLEGSFGGYLEKFSSKTRWTLRKKVKRFLAGAPPEAWREYVDLEGIRCFYELARAISARTYQQRLLDAGIARDPAFVAELEQLAQRGAVRGYLLFHGEQAVSYALCYAHGDTLTLDKTGFDPRFQDLHPGTVLTFLLIKRLFEEGRFRVFDFGSGYYEYKELFSTGSVPCADIIYLRRSVFNLLAVVAHAALDATSEGLKKLLDLVGMRARVKRLIHRTL